MKESITINYFSGLNAGKSPIDIAYPDSPYGGRNTPISNMQLLADGGITTRNPWRFFASAATSKAIDGMGVFSPSGTERLVVAAGGNLYQTTGQTAPTALTLIASALGIWTSGVEVNMVAARNYIFMSNGNVLPYKFDGTDFTRAGVSATTQALSIACGAAGVLTGTYTYKYAGFNSASVEGDIGTISNSIVNVAGRNTVSNIPTAPASFGINSWKIYRNTAGVTTTYWLVTSVTNGVTSFTDNNTDASLVTLAPTDNATPPYMTGMIAVMSRIFGFTANSSNLWYSNIRDPETFKSTNYIEINLGDGNNITALTEVDGGLLVHKNSSSGFGSLYYVFMPTATDTDWIVTRLDTTRSSVAKNSAIKFMDRALIVDLKGFYASRLVGGNDIQTEDIGEIIKSKIPTSAQTTSFAIDFDGKIYVYNKDRLQFLVYAYKYLGSRKGSLWTVISTGGGANFSLNNAVKYAGRILGGSSSADGQTYTVDSDYNGTSFVDYNGATNYAIVPKYSTAYLYGPEKYALNKKTWRCAFFYFHISNDIVGSVPIDVVAYDENSNLILTTTITPAYDGTELVDTFKLQINAVSRMISFGFSSTMVAANSSIRPIRIELYYNLLSTRQ